MLLTGCTAPSPDADPSPNTPPAPATGSPVPTPEPTPPVEPRSAEEGFRLWLDLSRLPDAPAACDLMAPALIDRMLDEAAAGGIPVGSCEEMVMVTAEMYRITGSDAVVDVEVREETATNATLFVTYLSSGKCGTVVMERARDDWILTEQSEVCGA